MIKLSILRASCQKKNKFLIHMFDGYIVDIVFSASLSLAFFNHTYVYFLVAQHLTMASILCMFFWNREMLFPRSKLIFGQVPVHINLPY